MIAQVSAVAIEMVNHSMMAHRNAPSWPAFQVVALKRCPHSQVQCEPVLVPPMGSVTIAFDADNPAAGRCPCHISTT